MAAFYFVKGKGVFCRLNFKTIQPNPLPGDLDMLEYDPATNLLIAHLAAKGETGRFTFDVKGPTLLLDGQPFAIDPPGPDFAAISQLPSSIISGWSALAAPTQDAIMGIVMRRLLEKETGS